MPQLLFATRHLRVHFPVLALLLTCCLFIQTKPAQALERNTVFLPFKINASEQGKLTDAADKALELEANAKGMTIKSRAEAGRFVNYAGAWPPPRAALEAAG